MSYNFQQQNNQNVDPFAHLENPNANPELNERFEENRQEFQENYAENLQNILGSQNSELYGRIAGSFEQSGDITAAVEINIDNIKNLEDSQRVKSVLLSFLQQNGNTQEIIQEDNVPKNLQSDIYNPNLETNQSLASRQEKINYQKSLAKNAQENLAQDLGLEDDQLEKKLNSTEERNKNADQMQTMIYNNESFLQSFMGETKQEIDANTQLLQDPEVQKDLNDILSQCVLPVEAHSIKDIYTQLGEEGVKQVDRSLNYAFEMQVAELLDGKVNYPQETIHVLCDKIRQGNPIEKITYYQTIKDIVHTKEGMGGAKQSKDYRAKSQLNNIKEQTAKQQFDEIRMLLSQADKTTQQQLETKKSQIDEILAMEQAEEAGGNVFAGDLNLEGIDDILSENTQKEQTA